MRAILFDLDGVIYQGDQVVKGAAAAIDWVKQQQIPYLFLTNTSSKPRRAIVDKLKQLGIAVAAEQIFTPPIAAQRLLSEQQLEPVALFVPDATRSDFGALDQPLEGRMPAAVVVGDLGPQWSFERLNQAFRLLMQNPPPRLLSLGFTRYWRAEDGLRLDVAPFVTALQCASGIEPCIIGKPGADFFKAALSLLNCSAAQTLMIGDDIVSDIGGAAAVGLRTVQVRTGKFRPQDEQVEPSPDWRWDSVAELPARWPQLLSA